MINKSLIIGLIMLFCVSNGQVLENQNSVFTIPYTTTFRSDLINKAMGCGTNVMYSIYLYPVGTRDALNLYTNPHSYGQSAPHCQFKTVFAKAFGFAQDYHELKNPGAVAGDIRKAVGNKIQNIVVEWKKPLSDNLDDTQQFLEQLIKQLSGAGMTVYLKAPASYFCRNVRDRPFLLSIGSIKKYIIQMYGEKTGEYKNIAQIFTNEESFETSEEYPNPRCPRFPSFKQLEANYPNKQFFIEKTLQPEEAGYLGSQFESILQRAHDIYNKLTFYDAYPPNLIRI